MGGRVFRSLEEVVERYKTEQIVEGFRLQKAVLKNDDNSTTDVYQTIRESRDAQKDNKDVLVKGWLHRRKKKWKHLYCVLNAKDTQLYLFESERRTRPKAVVDLNYSYVYLCHDSLFDRQHVFQVVERALPWYSH